MKTLRNKVILSAVVLAFALIATIGSTYAWFTVSQDVTVEQLTLNVKAEDSLLIKLNEGTETEADLRDVANYKTTLTNTDFTNSTAFAAVLSAQLSPVTAISTAYDDIDAKSLNYLTSLTDYTRPLAEATTYNSANGRFIEVSFWVYSQAATAKDVVLSSLAITAADQDGSREDVVNAVRLAVWASDVTYDTIDPLEAEAFIFGLDADYGFAFLNNGLPGFYTGTPDTTNFNTLDEKGLTSTGTLVAGSYTSTMATVDTDVIFTVQPNTPTLFTVRIYVEGWDASATNDIVSSVFAITWNLGFNA